MIHDSQGYIPCPACQEPHPIRNDVIILKEGNKYRCTKTGSLVEYKASDVLRDDTPAE